MASLPILWIQARVHCHATEDEARVREALERVLPAGETDRDAAEGHFGNPIVRLTRKTDDSRAVRQTWDAWRAAGVLASIAGDADARTDPEGVLHLRLDKQEAFLGRLHLARDADAIDVRVRLAAHPARADTFRRVARDLLGGT